MAHKRNKLEEKEYHAIKHAYHASRMVSPWRSEEKTIDLIAARGNRSSQTVSRVINTPSYKRYKLLSLIESRRNPDTTLGKRVDTIEKHLMVMGIMPMEEA